MATQSSGYTQQLATAAIRCDQARLLAKLQNGGVCSSVSVPSNKAALYASVLEQDAARGCPLTAEEQLRLPRVGVPESVRIQRVQQAAMECSVNPLNPATRFSMYTTFVPQVPCPPPTAEQLNSTQPRAPMIGCQPSRFF